MKKTGILLVLLAAVAAYAQQSDSTAAMDGPSGTAPTSVTFPFERVQTPTHADIYCAGFINPKPLPNANFVAGGLQTPNETRYTTGELVYLSGSGYQVGQEYSILRETRNPSKHEIFAGQDHMIKALGQPYADQGLVKIVDTRQKMAVAQVEYSCDAIVPGDIAVPYAERPAISFHSPVRFDRFAPAGAKTSGRIVLARDFDGLVGTGAKVYINVGSNQGVKPGDYFRAVRLYSADKRDEVDSLSFKADGMEDTQKNPPAIDPNFLNRTKGGAIHSANLPRRAVGEIVVLSATPTTATGMIVYALEDVHVGDGVELDEQAQQ
jgi:hypothetical protein